MSDGLVAERNAADLVSRGDPAWSRVLIVEGTSGVGKSTLIDQLIRRYVATQPARKLRTLLHLTQAHTYGPLAPAEDRGTLTPEQDLQHLAGIVSMLEWHVSALTAESQVKFLAVVDTLHLTHCHRPGVLAWKQVAGLDQRLARLGARLLFVRASAETLWTRGIVPRIEEEFITGYALPRFGSTLGEVHGYFVEEQERMRAHLTETAMPWRELDADADSGQNLEQAFTFWLE